MSRHSFETQYHGRPVVVTIGFDAPLQYYHAVVEYMDATDDDESPYVYSNLDDTEPFPTDLRVYREKFAELGIVIPERMFTETEADARGNIVNRAVAYYSDGSMVEHAPGRSRGARVMHVVTA